MAVTAAGSVSLRIKRLRRVRTHARGLACQDSAESLSDVGTTILNVIKSALGIFDIKKITLTFKTVFKLLHLCQGLGFVLEFEKGLACL